MKFYEVPDLKKNVACKKLGKWYPPGPTKAVKSSYSKNINVTCALRDTGRIKRGEVKDSGRITNQMGINHGGK